MQAATLILAFAILVSAAVRAYRERQARKRWEEIIERLFGQDDAEFEREARWGETTEGK